MTPKPTISPDYKSIVASAIACGLVHLPQPRLQQLSKRKFDKRQWVRQRCAGFKAAGLTYEGKPRKHKWTPRPELKGLIGREYKREYMRLIRGAKP